MLKEIILTDTEQDIKNEGTNKLVITVYLIISTLISIVVGFIYLMAGLMANSGSSILILGLIVSSNVTIISCYFNSKNIKYVLFCYALIVAIHLGDDNL